MAVGDAVVANTAFSVFISDTVMGERLTIFMFYWINFKYCNRNINLKNLLPNQGKYSIVNQHCRSNTIALLSTVDFDRLGPDLTYGKGLQRQIDERQIQKSDSTKVWNSEHFYLLQ